MAGSLLGPIAALVAVLALIPIALWLLKRTPLGAASTAGGMRIVGALPLAPNQRIVTVEVGAGDERQWLVLGVGAGGIRTLHTMAPQAPAAGSGDHVPQPFARLLARRRADAAADADGR